jgi:predicted methyltransferase
LTAAAVGAAGGGTLNTGALTTFLGKGVDVLGGAGAAGIGGGITLGPPKMVVSAWALAC